MYSRLGIDLSSQISVVQAGRPAIALKGVLVENKIFANELTALHFWTQSQSPTDRCSRFFSLFLGVANELKPSLQ